MEITVPPQFRAGFEKLARLKPGPFDQLVEVLNVSQLSLNLDPTVDAACKGMRSVPKRDVREILASLYSLAAFSIGSEDSVEDVSRAVAASIMAGEDRNTSETAAARLTEILSERLTTLLHVKNLHVAAKAAGLISSHPKVFTNARLMTDLRPIFDSEQGNHLVAAVRAHQLKIEYFENGRPQSFYVTLDDKDVETLKRIMDRAARKSKAIEAFMQKVALPMVNSH
jgi:hypothetical protein